MFPSFLAAFFFALNATCASHAVRALGTMRANLGRLVVGVLLLGLFAHSIGHGFASASTGWFFLSGIIGMGIGDLGVYAALPRLGSRLTVLMTQCLAAPIAALGEWWWLGTNLTVLQITYGLVILVGVAVALMPSPSSPPHVRIQPAGFIFGLVAALGQGLGALISRKGGLVATAAGESVHNVTFGLTSAYHRIVAGLVFTSAWFLVRHLLNRSRASPPAPSPGEKSRGYRWVVAAGIAGPVAGVGSYQWALATTPSGLVLPIVATTPLFSIPIAYWLERDRSTHRSIVGAVIAVAGCVALTLTH